MRDGPGLDLPDGRATVGADGRWELRDDAEPPTAATLTLAGTVGEGEPTGTLVRGEAARVMRALLSGDPPPHAVRGALAGAVQLVYIDPPYNTGGAFPHYPDAADHLTWLTALRERLTLLRDTLSPSGSLWLHVDDAEMAYAKVLCDEVFGRRNLVDVLVVENNPKGRQLGKFFAGSHDYLLVYARDIATVRIVPGSEDAVDPADFPHTDDVGRYRLLPLRNTNKRFNPVTARTLHYPLWADADSGRVAVDEFDGASLVRPVFGDLTPAVWRWSAARVRERGDELRARVVRGRTGPRLDVYQVDRMHPGRTKKLRSIWPSSEVGSSDSAKLELKALFPGEPIFSTPKPEPLLLRVLRSATEPGDLVLDCFAGSGTTAAVAHKAGRRWIAVEVSDETVTRCLLPRVRSVVAGTDGGGVSAACGWVGGGAVTVLHAD